MKRVAKSPFFKIAIELVLIAALKAWQGQK